ncbi:MAG TPA: hypothetical protein VMW38_27485 [Terriglobia bacterium]|nr:hypothetical protein [Terriglobia bacterium]
MIRTIFLGLTLSLVTAPVQEQSSPAAQSSYRLIQALNGPSFVDKVGKWTVLGYRVAAWDGASGIVAILEKPPEGSTARYEYVAVERPNPNRSIRTARNELNLKELNHLGASGFHLMRWTREPYVLLAEREAGRNVTYEYLVYSPDNWRDKGKLREARQEGYRVVGMLREFGVLEKSSDRSTTSSGEFRVIRERELAKLKRRLAQAAVEGYRTEAEILWLTEASNSALWLPEEDFSKFAEEYRGKARNPSFTGYWCSVLWMTKDSCCPGDFQYRVESNRDFSGFETLLNQAGKESYRLLTVSLFVMENKSSSNSPKKYPCRAAILEKETAKREQYEYRTFEEMDLPRTLERINKLAADGFRPTLIEPSPAACHVIMEKELKGANL